MEYWRVEKRRRPSDNRYSNPPTLQYSNTPKLLELKDSKMESLLLGYRSEKDRIP
jgi:hypothetical protein